MTRLRCLKGSQTEEKTRKIEGTSIGNMSNQGHLFRPTFLRLTSLAYFGGGLAKKGLGYFARYEPWQGFRQ